MPRASTKRRRLILTLLSIPAALTALLWIASHLWFIWYCSLPPGTLMRRTTPAPPSLKIRILAGAVHCTDDAAHRRDTIARMNTGRPMPGSMSLGTMFDGQTGMAHSGLHIKWSPYGLSATEWKPSFYSGNWSLPLYIPLLLFLFPPLAFWILSRPRIPGLCSKCNYNRSGLPPLAKCPECGTTPAQN